MSYYLVQATYTSQTWSTLVKHPQNRAEAIRKLVEQVGGSVVGSWVAFGEHDVIVIYQAPDNITAGAISATVTSTGAFSAYKTTPLLSPEEAQAMAQKAGDIAYSPPQ